MDKEISTARTFHAFRAKCDKEERNGGNLLNQIRIIAFYGIGR